MPSIQTQVFHSSLLNHHQFKDLLPYIEQSPYLADLLNALPIKGYRMALGQTPVFADQDGFRDQILWFNPEWLKHMHSRKDTLMAVNALASRAASVVLNPGKSMSSIFDSYLETSKKAIQEQAWCLLAEYITARQLGSGMFSDPERNEIFIELALLEQQQLVNVSTRRLSEPSFSKFDQMAQAKAYDYLMLQSAVATNNMPIAEFFQKACLANRYFHPEANSANIDWSQVASEHIKTQDIAGGGFELKTDPLPLLDGRSYVQRCLVDRFGEVFTGQLQQEFIGQKTAAQATAKALETNDVSSNLDTPKQAKANASSPSSEVVKPENKKSNKTNKQIRQEISSFSSPIMGFDSLQFANQISLGVSQSVAEQEAQINIVSPTPTPTATPSLTQNTDENVATAKPLPPTGKPTLAPSKIAAKGKAKSKDTSQDATPIPTAAPTISSRPVAPIDNTQLTMPSCVAQALSQMGILDHLNAIHQRNVTQAVHEATPGAHYEPLQAHIKFENNRFFLLVVYANPLLQEARITQRFDMAEICQNPEDRAENNGNAAPSSAMPRR